MCDCEYLTKSRRAAPKHRQMTAAVKQPKQVDVLLYSVNLLLQLLISLYLLPAGRAMQVHKTMVDQDQYFPPGLERTSLSRGAISNVSDIIDDLLDGYDIRLRPQFGGKSTTSKRNSSIEHGRCATYTDVLSIFLIASRWVVITMYVCTCIRFYTGF